jgi:hypothetical protein
MFFKDICKGEQKMKPHKHKWKEDEMFKSGAVTMLCGNAKDFLSDPMSCREMRMICKCGAFKYVKIKR